MMVVGCSAPVVLKGGDENLWNCGGSLGEEGLQSPRTPCPGSASSQVLYVWSLGGAGLQLPAGTSVPVGGAAGVQHIVLQVHYIR